MFCWNQILKGVFERRSRCVGRAARLVFASQEKSQTTFLKDTFIVLKDSQVRVLLYICIFPSWVGQSLFECSLSEYVCNWNVRVFLQETDSRGKMKKNNMTLNAAQNFERQLVRAPPKESQDRSCRKLTRFRHAPFHTCYLYPVHLWPGSSVNWGPTFRKHRKYDINTPRLCPRDARDLSLAHFPASIYPGKTSPSRLQEGLPPPPASSHHAAKHAASITKQGNHTWE